MVEISKADWKLFRERVPEWQEHYMERLTKKYIEMLSSPGNASDHFWELENRIKNDKKHPGVMMEMNKIRGNMGYCHIHKEEGNHPERSGGIQSGSD